MQACQPTGHHNKWTLHATALTLVHLDVDMGMVTQSQQVLVLIPADDLEQQQQQQQGCVQQAEPFNVTVWLAKIRRIGIPAAAV
jgi:hypothetical protein